MGLWAAWVSALTTFLHGFCSFEFCFCIIRSLTIFLLSNELLISARYCPWSNAWRVHTFPSLWLVFSSSDVIFFTEQTVLILMKSNLPSLYVLSFWCQVQVLTADPGSQALQFCKSFGLVRWLTSAYSSNSRAFSTLFRSPLQIQAHKWHIIMHIYK